MSKSIESKAGESQRPSWGGFSGRLKASLVRALRGGEGRSAWDFSSYNILPSGITAEINANKGSLGKEGISQVVFNSRYTALGFYLFTKGLEGNRAAQIDTIAQVIDAAQVEDPTVMYRDVVKRNIDSFPDTMRVKADKLFLASRVGPEAWDRRFAETADKFGELKGKRKFVLAYAPFAGLHHFLAQSRATGEDLNVLVENWFMNPDEELCGYKVNSSRGTVSFLPKDFPKPEQLVVVDDVLNKGDHAKRALGFLRGVDPSEIKDLSDMLVLNNQNNSSS